MATLEMLRAEIAIVKAAPFHGKGAAAEKALDAAVAVLADFELRLSMLENERGEGGGESE